MLILLTNDDGIRAPGIAALYRALTQLGEVRVVAPETVQSATGHGITLTTPLLSQEVTVENAFTGTAVDGRPADCVKVAVSHLLPRPPDLVVSGINSGANVGINVLYSGTVAAAIEAAFLGLPAIAVSLLLRRDVPSDYDHAAAVALPTIRRLIDGGLKGGQVMNVNLPALPTGVQPKGVRLARQCTNVLVDTYEKRADPRGNPYFWNSTEFRLHGSDEGTDVSALRDGYVAVTPLTFDLTDDRELERMRGEAGGSEG